MTDNTARAWTAGKQDATTLSSTEAEYITLGVGSPYRMQFGSERSLHSSTSPPSPGYGQTMMGPQLSRTT